MLVAGLVLAGIAAAIHVFIFYLESIVWTGQRARTVFGTSIEEAQTTKLLAFNQGFYNLFLAIVIALGIIFVAAGSSTIGLTLIFTGTGSMVAAGLVLLISSPSKASSALKQLAAPLLAVMALIIDVLR